MLLAVDFDEDLVDVEGITVAPVLSLQSSTVYSTELDAPQADRFSRDSDTPFGKQRGGPGCLNSDTQFYKWIPAIGLSCHG